MASRVELQESVHVIRSSNWSVLGLIEILHRGDTYDDNWLSSGLKCASSTLEAIGLGSKDASLLEASGPTTLLGFE